MTIDVSRDIHSLTDFKRRTNALLRRMRKSGHPLVLTVNGKAELVVLDAAAYQRLAELIDRAEAVEGIRRGLEDVKQGRTKPARQFFEDMRREFKIPREA